MLLSSTIVVSLNLPPQKYPNKTFSVTNFYKRNCFKKFDCANFTFHTCNHARLGKSWNKFNFFQAGKIDLWNKTKAAIETIRIGTLIKVLEEIEVWIGTKFLMEIKQTEKIIGLILNEKPRRRRIYPLSPKRRTNV